MRVVLGHSNLGGLGGGERFVLEEAKHLSRNHNVEIVTWSYVKERTFPGFCEFKIHELKAGGPSVRKLMRWSNYLGSADVFSTHGFPSNFLSLKNSRTVWYCHTMNLPFQGSLNPKYLLSRFMDAKAVRRADRVVANSNFTKERIRDYYGVESCVITPGVEPKEFKSGPFGDYVLLVSRISPEKRIELAIEAMKLVPDLRLVMVAGWTDESYRRSLNLKGGKIEVLENVSEAKLKDLYSGCLCVLQTATEEPFGMVALEAMASGKPVVAPDRAGFRETLDKSTGFLTEPDAAEISERIRYLDQNRADARRMGGSGRKRVRLFTWKRKMEEIEKVLESVASNLE